MSAKISGCVWELDLPREEKYVLLCFADHADHEGNNVYPSVGLIAWKTGYSERRVQELMRGLEERHLLVKVNAGTGRGNTTLYRIDIDAGTIRERQKKGAKISPFIQRVEPRKGEIPQPKRVRPVAQKGELATAPESKEPKAVTFPQAPSIEILRHRPSDVKDAADFQDLIQQELQSAGFETRREEFVLDRGDASAGRIDLVAKRGGEVIAIECDRQQPRQKSESKLLSYPAHRRWIVLRDPAEGFLNVPYFEDLISRVTSKSIA